MATKTKTNTEKVAEYIAQGLAHLLEPGQVVELRIPKAEGRGNRTDSGYFDDPQALAQAAVKYSGRAPGVYITLNPVNPALLARANNRVVSWAKNTTSDNDIQGRRWLMIDLDAERPAGISSTNEEHDLALATAKEIAAWLSNQGWPSPIMADSGNGAHILYRIDLDNTSENADLVSGCLQALDFWFNSEKIKVDQTVYNAARIWKVYGTLAAKGDHTEERPHRYARLLDVPESLEIVTLAQLQALAAQLPSQEQPQPEQRPYRGKRLELESWIQANALDVKGPRPWKDGRKWVFNVCPWNGDHTDNSAYILEMPSGAIAAGCHHNGCSGKTWADLRALYDGPKEERPQRPTAHKNGASPGPATEEGVAPEQAGLDAVRASSWPYAIAKGELAYQREKVDQQTGEIEILSTPLASFQARIAEEITTEEGEQFYIIQGIARRGGAFTVEVPATDFGEPRKLAAALEAGAGPKDPIYAGQTKHIGPALKLLTGDNLQRRQRYNRTGWDNGRFLIPGREPKGVEISLEHKQPYEIDASAQLALGLEALQALIESMGADTGPIVLSFLFGAPLARLAGWGGERYALFIKGRTGTLKTSNAQTALCLYGPGFQRESELIKWGEGATRNAIMAIAARSHDMPIMLDNYKPSTGGGARDFINLIHNIVEGGEKLRLNRASQLRESKAVFAWPLCTGEDVPDNDPASLARTLIVPFSWNRGETNSALAKAQDLALNLSAVGGAWLAWLESEEGRGVVGEAAKQLTPARTAWAAHLRRVRPDMQNILRVSSNLAINELVWRCVAAHPDIGPIAQAHIDSHKRGLETIAGLMGEYTAESLEAIRFLGALRELIAGRAVFLASDTSDPAVDPDRFIGWADGEGGAYLLPELARKHVDRLVGDGLGFISNNTLYDQLGALGFIASSDKGRRTKRKRAGGENRRTLHLTAAALREPENAQGEAE